MKYKKGQTVEIMLSGIIAIIVGVVMLPIFSSLIDDAQNIKSVDLEQLTNTGFNRSFTLANPDLVSGTIAVVNSTCGTEWVCTANLSTLRDGFEFTLNEFSGIINIINRTGTWNVSYDYEPSTYVDSATGRTVIKQVTLMYAVALIIITLAAVGIRLSRG